MRGKVLAVAWVCLYAVQLEFSTPAQAQSTTYIGCLECIYKSMVTIPRDYCSQVGDEEEGWTQCTEETYNLSRFCTLSGSACYNVDAGGGGGSGSGGGDACVIGSSAPCPAECFSCERDPYQI